MLRALFIVFLVPHGHGARNWPPFFGGRIQDILSHSPRCGVILKPLILWLALDPFGEVFGVAHKRLDHHQLGGDHYKRTGGVKAVDDGLLQGVVLVYGSEDQDHVFTSGRCLVSLVLVVKADKCLVQALEWGKGRRRKTFIDLYRSG